MWSTSVDDEITKQKITNTFVESHYVRKHLVERTTDEIFALPEYPIETGAIVFKSFGDMLNRKGHLRRFIIHIKFIE